MIGKMNLKHLLTLAFVSSALLFSLASCKDDDDDSTGQYLDGTLSFTMPSYVTKGQSFKVVPKGISHPDGGKVGYYWVITDYMDTNDTTKFLTDGPSKDSSFTFACPNDLGDYTIKAVAFADDYYDSSVSKSFTVVDSGLNETLTGLGIKEGDPSFYDNRSDISYYYMDCDKLRWMKQNLAYAKSGVAYENSVAMSDVFGMFYTWDEAQTVCPSGWRLPTDADWTALANTAAGENKYEAGKTFSGIGGKLMANVYFNGTKMWEYWPEVTISNSSAFTAIPAGYAIVTDGTGVFSGVQEYATFWTADEKDSDEAVYRYMNVKLPDVFVGAASKNSFAASVRCVKDL